MKRIVKDPEVRRAEIMDVAEKLFEKEGYTQTSVESIIKKAGIAKGTFYYYFKAKEDILQALVEKTTADMEAYFLSILELEKLGAIEKLKLMFRGPKKKKITSSAVVKIMHKPENRELQEKSNIAIVKTIPPIIVKVFEQGKKEGVFSNVPSVELLQITLAGSQFVLDSGLFAWSSQKRTLCLKEIQKLFELMVGVRAGTLNFISRK